MIIRVFIGDVIVGGMTFLPCLISCNIHIAFEVDSEQNYIYACI